VITARCARFVPSSVSGLWACTLANSWTRCELPIVAPGERASRSGQAWQQIRESHREELAVQFAFLLMQIDPVDEALAANEVSSHPGEEFAS